MSHAAVARRTVFAFVTVLYARLRIKRCLLFILEGQGEKLVIAKPTPKIISDVFTIALGKCSCNSEVLRTL